MAIWIVLNDNVDPAVVVGQFDNYADAEECANRIDGLIIKASEPDNESSNK